MKLTKVFVFIAIFAFSFVTIAISQTPSAHPAKPAGTPTAKPQGTQTEPTLAETMTFIQNKLTANSSIGYLASVQNNTNKNQTSNTYNIVFTDIKVSAAKCSITYHKKLTLDGETLADVDTSTLFKDVESVVVKALPTVMTADSAKAGHPELTTLSTNPKITLLTLNRYDAGQSSFYFTDLSLAYRMKKAVAHAVQLCGGGKKEPF